MRQISSARYMRVFNSVDLRVTAKIYVSASFIGAYITYECMELVQMLVTNLHQRWRVVVYNKSNVLP